jgi:hypothetical protein
MKKKLAVFETYGGIAMDGRKLLRLLAAQAGDSRAAQNAFVTHAYRALSVRLQRGNAKISKVYAHMLRTADTLCDHRGSDRHGGASRTFFSSLSQSCAREAPRLRHGGDAAEKDAIW